MVKKEFFKLKNKYSYSNPAILWAVALGLYCFYLFGHVPVSNFCYYLRDTYTEAVYREAVLTVGKVLLLIFLVGLSLRLWVAVNATFKTVIWVFFGAILAYYYSDLVKISIEYVHFIQYCVLTTVVTFGLKGRVFLAVLLCMFAGFWDEVYQALAPLSPLNWRDICLNVTGCVWGWLVVWTLESKRVEPRILGRAWLKLRVD